MEDRLLLGPSPGEPFAGGEPLDIDAQLGQQSRVVERHPQLTEGILSLKGPGDRGGEQDPDRNLRVDPWVWEGVGTGIEQAALQGVKEMEVGDLIGGPTHGIDVALAEALENDDRVVGEKPQGRTEGGVGCHSRLSFTARLATPSAARPPINPSLPRPLINTFPMCRYAERVAVHKIRDFWDDEKRFAERFRRIGKMTGPPGL